MGMPKWVIAPRGNFQTSGCTIIGDPRSVADQMEEWFGTACDGFVLAASHVPGAYEDFGRLVVPELQRRGLFQTEYVGATLRENLGIVLPHKGRAA